MNNPEKTSSISYRPEIDGLRAVAVLPVIFFHAGFQTFSGGFIGVDVFFVISGYLITSILLNELEQNEFSIIKFYERRARRILPALTFVLIFCTWAAYELLLPEDFERYGLSLASVALFSSNIYFWQSMDYFAPAAEDQPLLHTWSLAVEEQYYVIFPVLLYFGWRFGRKNLLLTIAAISLLSLGLSEWGWRYKQDANFFLLPTRAWELLAGSLMAFKLNADPLPFQRTRMHNELLSISGLVLIGYAIFAFDQFTPFPSLYTLTPVVGSLLVICFARTETLVGALLSSAPFVAIGLISYSAYLWHQPILSLYRSMTTELAPITAFILVALSLLMATASYWVVEKPFRVRAVYAKRSALFAGSFVSLSLTLAVGSFIYIKDGLASRYSTQQTVLVDKYLKYDHSKDWRLGRCMIFLDTEDKEAFDKECFGFLNGKPKLFLIGDSHAAALYPGVAKVFSDSYDVSQLTISGCYPFTHLKTTVAKRCRDLNPARFKAILDSDASSKVIIHANWSPKHTGANGNDRVELKRTLQLLKTKLPTSHITLVGCVPIWKPSLPKYLMKKQLSILEPGLPTHIGNNDSGERAKCNSHIQQIASEEGVRFVNGWDAFCKNGECLIKLDRAVDWVGTGGDFELTAFDWGHLTHTASIFLAEQISPALGR